eukprot:m.52421 g.52421  ORF g.52421 m.52421 type:complete len:153 (-) comp12700_c1_seq1:381-839(-)
MEEFQADSGASEMYPMQCSSLRKNGYVVIKDRPCKITDMSTSKTGKHGHAKVNLVGVDIFTGKKYEDICPSTHNMNVPVVKRNDYQLIDIDGDYLTLMSDDGDTREDLKKSDIEAGILDDVLARHANGEDMLVTVLAAMGTEQIVQVKNLTT